MRLIDADVVLSYIDRLLNCGLGKNKSLNYIRKFVEKQPPVEPVHGEWIVNPIMFTNECSICHKTHKFASCANFCPNCGADMRKKVTE